MYANWLHSMDIRISIFGRNNPYGFFTNILLTDFGIAKYFKETVKTLNMKVNNSLYLHRYVIRAVDVQDISIELAQDLWELHEGFYSKIKIRYTSITTFVSFSVERS